MSDDRKHAPKSMLIISRDVGESVVIDGHTEITYDGYSTNEGVEIRLVIKAPRDVRIMRKELIK